MKPQKPAVRYCSHCGKPVFPDAVFCQYCGSKLYIDAEDNGFHEDAQGEGFVEDGKEIKGFFRVTRVGLRRLSVYYVLFFTDERLIGAKIGTQSKKLVAATLIGAVIGGLIGGLIGSFLGAVIGYYLVGYSDTGKEKLEAMRNLPIENILKADQDNFEIPYSIISKIKMRRPTLRDRLMSETGRLAGIIKIFDEKEQKFNIAGKQSFEDCVKIVRSVLPDKLEAKYTVMKEGDVGEYERHSELESVNQSLGEDREVSVNEDALGKMMRNQVETRKNIVTLAVVTLLLGIFFWILFTMPALNVSLGLASRVFGLILGIGLGVGSIIVAIGYWSSRRWSRILGLIFSGIEMFLMVTLIILVSNSSAFAMFYIFKDIGTIYYLTRPNVKTYLTNVSK